MTSKHSRIPIKAILIILILGVAGVALLQDSGVSLVPQAFTTTITETPVVQSVLQPTAVASATTSDLFGGNADKSRVPERIIPIEVLECPASELLLPGGSCGSRQLITQRIDECRLGQRDGLTYRVEDTIDETAGHFLDYEVYFVVGSANTLIYGLDCNAILAVTNQPSQQGVVNEVQTAPSDPILDFGNSIILRQSAYTDLQRGCQTDSQYWVPAFTESGHGGRIYCSALPLLQSRQPKIFIPDDTQEQNAAQPPVVSVPDPINTTSMPYDPMDPNVSTKDAADTCVAGQDTYVWRTYTQKCFPAAGDATILNGNDGYLYGLECLVRYELATPSGFVERYYFDCRAGVA